MTTSLHCIKPNAAGIDIGSKSHFVAVPSDRDDKFIREFKFFTEDLYALSDWLKSCKIDTVAMESTGVYWLRHEHKRNTTYCVIILMKLLPTNTNDTY